MPRIIVGIPTYDEAATIAHVVQSVDEGLKLIDRRCGPVQAKIVNSDSLSQDETVRIFSEQHTFFPKQQVSTSGSPGKGKNVRRLLDIAAAFDADCLLLLDGDLYSIRPEWLPTLGLPVLHDGADFVIPRYLRNRFEGGITNHLCVPLIYSVFGRYVRQPIAGDFGLSRRFIERIRQAAWPPAADYYGIDITMTITALEASCHRAEAVLDQKVHKPVIVPKFSWTFTQVCEAALSMVRDATIAPRADSITAAGESFNDNVAFPFDETTAVLLDTAEKDLRAWSATHEIETYPMADAVRLMVGKARNGVPLEADVFSELWCDVLTEAIRAAIAGSHEAQPMASLLLPAFLVKMCSFWAKVRASPPKEIEAQVVRLAKQVRSSISASIESARS